MIGIFDSGVGGLSVFREVHKALPEAAIFYYGDTANCPYGDKSQEFIINRTKAITEEMLRKGCDIIVVACNTATAAAIRELRASYSDSTSEKVRSRVLSLTGGRRDHVMFIGMEPAVKPAVAATRSGVIGVLATAGTLKGQKYHDMRELYKGNVKVVEQVGKGFVELVEKGITSGPEAESVVENSLRPLIEAGADTIVLGCTHYPFLEDTIKKTAESLASGSQVTVINPAPAVAKHLIEVMKEDSVTTSDISGNLPRIIYQASGEEATLRHMIDGLCQGSYM